MMTLKVRIHYQILEADQVRQLAQNAIIILNLETRNQIKLLRISKRIQCGFLLYQEDVVRIQMMGFWKAPRVPHPDPRG